MAFWHSFFVKLNFDQGSAPDPTRGAGYPSHSLPPRHKASHCRRLWRWGWGSVPKASSVPVVNADLDPPSCQKLAPCLVPSPMDHVSHVVLYQHLLSMHRSRVLVQRCTIPGVIHGSQSLDLNQLGGVWPRPIRIHWPQDRPATRCHGHAEIPAKTPPKLAQM